MDSKLYKVAKEGHVPSLLKLLAKDKSLLNRIMIGNHIGTPLHITIMLKHLEVMKKVLARKAN